VTLFTFDDVAEVPENQSGAASPLGHDTTNAGALCEEKTNLGVAASKPSSRHSHHHGLVMMVRTSICFCRNHRAQCLMEKEQGTDQARICRSPMCAFFLVNFLVLLVFVKPVV
jgi:hypothetical protein